MNLPHQSDGNNRRDRLQRKLLFQQSVLICSAAVNFLLNLATLIKLLREIYP